MKKLICMVACVVFIATTGFAQDLNSSKIPLIGSKAPSFTAQSTNGKITYPKDFANRWTILFSHPLDFTPVCSSELLELAHAQEDFKQLGVDFIVISTDTLSRHFKWKQSLENLSYKGHGPTKIHFPLVDDNNKKISISYGMLHTPVSTVKDVRGVFIVDNKQIVRAIQYYPMEVGRDITELKRLVIALQTTDANKVLTPANWNPGDHVLVPYLSATDKSALSNQSPDIYQLDWYMTFKKLDNEVVSVD